MVNLKICCFLVAVTCVNGQDYGPVDLNSLDPLTLSWNEIHWLVRDQITEVEELKREHDEIYNQITGCFGLEKCLGEFDLLNMEPGSKLYQLGLRRLEVEDLAVRGEDIMKERQRLQNERREKDKQLILLQQQQEAARRDAALQARITADAAKETSRIERVQQHRTVSNTMFSSHETHSSSRHDSMAGVEYEPGLDMENSWTSYFSNSSVYGPKPAVFQHGYKYSRLPTSRPQQPYRNN